MITLFVIGLVAALLVEELTGVIPGGAVVPGFLAVAAARGWVPVAVTVAAAMAAAGATAAARRLMPLFGRRRLTYAVLAGAAAVLAAERLGPVIAPARSPIGPDSLSGGEALVGYIVPGLLADRALTQGAWKTAAAAVAAAALALLASLAVGAPV